MPLVNRNSLRSDVSAGLTTAVMLVPQAMAYALLAGLPPIMGLYAATVPLLVYALMGSSRQLAVGPMAMASLIMASGLRELGQDPELLVALALSVTFCAGVVQVALALARLGGLVNLLSHPVVTGFTQAAAILIGISQLPVVLNLEIPDGMGAFTSLHFMAGGLTAAHEVSIVVGALCMAILFGLQRYAPKVPAALTVVVLGITLSWALGLQELGVSVLGDIPSGMPSYALPNLSMEQIIRVGPLAVTVALIGFMESISAASVYARQNRYEVSPSSELVALGFSNMSAALFGGYTVGGALSRTAVNAQAGAVTPLANVVTAVAVLITLTFLTPVFYFLPTPVLAAIILVAVIGLIDIPEVIHLWRVKRDDLVLLLITFLATLFLSIEVGILIGVLCSLLWLVYTSTRPEIRVLGRIPGTRSYRCVDHFDEAETSERILVLRMDAQFFFGNIAYLKQIIFEHLEQRPETVAIVLDGSSMNALDSTASDTLCDIIRSVRAERVEIFLSHIKGSVLKVMSQTEVLATLGQGHVHYEVHDAVKAAKVHREAVEQGVSPEEESFAPSDMLD